MELVRGQVPSYRHDMFISNTKKDMRVLEYMSRRKFPVTCDQIVSNRRPCMYVVCVCVCVCVCMCLSTRVEYICPQPHTT